jgi:HAD superfamily hydrolase (TIGR01549 family)
MIKIKDMSKNLKAVLFDLDDTLFDHRHSMQTGLAALQKIYPCFAKDSLDEFERVHVTLMNDIHLTQIMKGEISIDEGRAIRFQRVFKHYGIEADWTLANEAASHYRANYTDVNRLVHGAYELLSDLKQKYKIGIVTNNLIDEQVRKLKEGKIEHLIDVMVTSEEVKITKPNPEIFLELMNRLDVTAEECIMIGDHWESDVTGAHALGIKCIWVNVYGLQCPDPNMAVEVKSMEDVSKIIACHSLLPAAGR